MSGFKNLLQNGVYRTSRVDAQIPLGGTSTGGVLRGATSQLGDVYVLLGASATQPCRIRLYSTSQSIAIDDARAVSDFNINPDVGLNLEVVFSGEGAQTLQFDPPVIGTTFTGSNTWYTVSSSAGINPNIQISAYPISNNNITRQTLAVSRSVSPSAPVSGNMASPKSFLILSGSANVISRLRLYSSDAVPAYEKSRTFGTVPQSGSKLIADLMFDAQDFSYKINPVIEGYTWSGTAYGEGTNVVHYILENRSATPNAPLTASLNIVSLED